MCSRKEKGFLLITAFLFTAMLATASLGLGSRHVAYIQSAERSKNKTVAFNMAEAGMDTAIANLKTDSNYSGVNNYTYLSTGNIEGGYTVMVCPPTCNGVTQPADSTMRLVVASGFSPSNVSSDKGYQARTLQAYVKVQSSQVFSYAILAKNNITLSGNAVTDSYNSTSANYSAATATANGHVGTDSSSAGAVSLSGNARINGNAIVGPGGNINTGILTSGNAAVTGTRSVANSAQNPAAQSSSAASEGALSVSGNTTYNLTAGTHRFSSISVSGNGKIKVVGAAILYIDGAISISGNGFATQSNKPPNLIIYSTGSSSVSISGNGNFYGAIHAPNSNVTNSGNGSIYGAVIAKNYTQTGNGSIHFDQALQTAAGTSGSSSATLQSWVENNTYYTN